MTHPDFPSPDLLADYVDGTLPEAERAALQTHVASCARCTREVAEASAARAALARLPDAEPPVGITDPAIAEAAGHAVGRRPDRAAPTWYRWGGIAAVAAAFALVLTLVLPKIGGGGPAERAAVTGGAAAATQGGPVRIEISSTNYRNSSLTQLATEVGARVTPRTGALAPEPSNVATSGTVGSAAQTVAASSCVQRAFREVSGRLVRLIQAKFQGQDAYVALYAEGPGAGQPADAVTVRVAAVSGCRPLSIAQAPLSSSGP